MATFSQPAPLTATGPAHSPELADAGWARGAAVFGYISSALILGSTAGIVAMNEDSGDEARTLGIVTTLYLAASAPIVAVGGASAREHPSVKGATALRIVSWIGYGLTLVDAAFLIGVSFESEVSSAHIASVGVLGALSTLGLAVDAHASANEADRVRGASSGALAHAPLRLTLRPTLGVARVGIEGSGRRAPLLGVRGEF